MISGIYIGKVRHRRLHPRRHSFSYSLFMMYVDLAELDQLFRKRWLWSARRPALAWFRRRDHFGDPNLPLETCVRDLVEQETGRRPEGSVGLLTHLRYWGYCFNPISIYYCFDASGRHLQALVAEVTNTPWGERHCYVLNPSEDAHGQQRYRFRKAMHVSPFMPMALDYDWRCNQPGERLYVHMDVIGAGNKIFDATLGLRRQSISGPALAGVLLRFPVMTLKLVAAIYWEAFRLWLKRIPFFAHPLRTGNPAEGYDHE
jgi:DUF1365 family protein